MVVLRIRIFIGLAHWSFPAFIGGRLDGNGVRFICDLSVNFSFVLQVLVTTVRPLFIHYIRCVFGLIVFDMMSEVWERK